MSGLSLRVFRLLLVPALIGTIYLYFYPTFHQCTFPRDSTSGDQAPFRLLALGDPQLEGDTSLPEHGHTELFPSIQRILNSIQRSDLGAISRDGGRLLYEDIPKALRTYHKKLDLWGNDQYLAHMYRTVSRHTDPTHVVVLGDLLGSQWIDDEEFGRRSNRFWGTVFSGAGKVPSDISDYKNVPAEELRGNKSWKNRIIAVAGNHDIGYAGDIDEKRIERFEDAFGRVNYDINFKLNGSTIIDKTTKKPLAPELRLIILNSMNLDSPAAHAQLQQDSIDHMNERLYWQIPQTDTTGTILLTHIPLFKESGICTDGPFFDYFPDRGPKDYFSNSIKEQNHLTYDVSARILEGVVGPSRTRSAIILNGHDHTGCDTYHSRSIIEDIPEPPPPEVNPEEEDDEDGTIAASKWNKPAPPPPEREKWLVQRYAESGKTRKNETLTGVREVTVRSMMGQFGGNAGLLSAWFNVEKKEWEFEYDTCAAGVQHIWWAIHVLDLIVVGMGVLGAVSAAVGGSGGSGTKSKNGTKTTKKKSSGKNKKNKQKQ
ncbi:Putative calcineurin-like phosphoesterase domain, ApaH type, metallo-dependent phosphatase [Septoria linicola]|uniref:Calcineurin-like phosphoesterase domain, ApaH type, metallo-dependent phosphatase n=1 Tax=Septoria linicola TaxID=215465 RepID=A0A9Q9AN81_9PEZI|nr:putative calcineurin-like phosphoesterase domain, ApaH type, metallo-dependent phosphatase [Septoria linicola]USW49198.1 Putative calcineurin-like phosphoesterase domain, ApaH type, metallo-dependent phosphatase [Septoria linicola]